MTAVSAINRRAVTAGAVAVGAALTLTGCGAGQVSQTAEQAAAVNGASANVGSVALRNVRVLFPDAATYTNTKGGKAALAFAAVNDSAEAADKITKISSDAGTVTITPQSRAVIPPQRVLVAAGPEAATDESAKPAETSETAAAADETTAADSATEPILVEISGLKSDLQPGLVVPVTFEFERAGSVDMQVPIDAGTEMERHDSAASGESAEGGGH
ncbi:hypothetical protein [Skermania piniformis]|uniref:Copper chaperone PCu(A)C n=1 Tax=Skermania pinensis TaxID=39122 RepID=A0ABX8S703_9ACTN|nr:hypothetical protein [Skermania piniformis]QXQ13623.1 hypothetical protein KV203_17740 [Skermania piniformis]